MAQFHCETTFFRFTMYDRKQVSKEILSIIEDPERHLNDEKTVLIQNNFKSTIGVVKTSAKKVVIKKHNYKSATHKFRRFFRPTRASKNWKYSHLLLSHGVRVPRPIACIETRIGVLRGMSYFIYEYVEGITAEEYFEQHQENAQKINQAINTIMKLMGRIHTLSLIHGDIRMANMIFCKDQLWLLDLDDMRPKSWFKPPRVKKRDIRGLQYDIRCNIPLQLQQKFLDVVDKI